MTVKNIIQKILPIVVIIFITTNSLFASFGKWLFAPEDVKTFIAMIGIFPLLTIWALFYKNENNFTIVQTHFYLPLALFLMWCFISFEFIAVDTVSASYITYQYATMIATLFLVLHALTTTQSITLFLNVLLAVAFAITVLALLQFYLPLNVSVQNFVYQAVIPAGTFGNKNMLGHLLVIVFAISLIFNLYAKTIFKSIIYMLLVVVFATMMIHINTRATWIASSLILFLLAFIWFFNKDILKKITLKKAKSVIFIGGFVLWFLAINTNHNGFTWRFDSIENRISSTINSQNPRIPMWVNTLEMIKDNPIVGVGVGGWENEYPKYYDRVLKDATFNESVRAERVHNEYLAMLSGMGIVGFFIFLWGVVSVVKLLLFLLKHAKNDDVFLTLAMGLAIFGFSINAFFSFPVRVFFPAFLIMAFVGVLLSLKQKYQPQYFYFSKQFGYLLSVPIIMLGVIFAYNSYNILLSKNYYYEADALSRGGTNNSIVFDRLLKSLYHNPENPQTLAYLGDKAVRLRQFDKGIELLQKSLKVRPFVDFTYMRLAMAYDVSGNKPQAIHTLLQLLNFDAKNVRAHGQLARLYLEQNDLKNAKKHQKLMLTWVNYFKGRNGFGPYDNIIGVVEKKFSHELKTLHSK